MNWLRVSRLLLSALLLGGAFARAESPVRAELVADVEQAVPGGEFRAGVLLRVDEGWHVFGEDPGFTGLPTEIEWETSGGVTVGSPRFPAEVEFEVFGEPARGHTGTVLIWARVRVAEDAAMPVELRARVSWAAVAEEDYLPDEVEDTLTIPLGDTSLPATDGVEWPEEVRPETAVAEGEADTPARPLLPLLLLGLAGGLILNLMPCVFPVIGLKIMGFVNQAGEDRARIVGHGLVFSGGVLVSFWILAGALIALRAGGGELGWGFQLQDARFVLILTVILLAFGLNMSGVFEIGMSAVGVGDQLTAKPGYAGSFFSGVLATVVATPCAAPFLAPALGAALTLPAASSLAVFTAIAIGLALPYLALSAFPNLISKLPRPGAWMESLKQFLSFLLYGTVAYLLWVLADQVEGDFFLLILFALVVMAMGCWVYGRWSLPHRRRQVRWAARAGAALLLILPFGFVWRGIADEERRRELIAQIEAGEAEQDFLIWQPWSEAKVEELRAEGRFVYIDFTARWCATCQVNKRAYENAEVIRAFLKNDVALLRADWTQHDPAITRALAKFDRSAIPFNVLYAPGQDEPVIFPELFGSGTVLEKLAEAGAELPGED